MASQPSLPLASLGLDANTTLGAALMGGFTAAIVYGITTLQTFLFFRGRSHNNKWMSLTVAGLWIVNSAHMALVIHPIYWYAVTKYLDPFAIGNIVWSVSAGIVFTAVNDVVVRGWFVYRIYVLSHYKKWAALPLALLCIVLFGVTLATGVKAYQTKTYTNFEKIHWLLDTDLSLVFVADVVIAIILCFLLAMARAKTINRRTESYINILILYTINTGLLTSMLSLACLITFVTMPFNYVFLSLYFPMANLYANSLLASFNMRDSFRAESTTYSVPLTPIVRHRHSAARCQCTCHLGQADGSKDIESDGELVIHISTEESKATL
ncbi:hypothetical protein PsYK624_098140 [Phanerochaete sordida]|uniref:DUF6534 domain-containing protein n=1 Tax=Phanerochaete sordida TaxID=48140 RepID=A0A9P3LGI0_9APHY|nr:hypothetical protein PsYK624_098140 [Phanerochaete sordida]